MLVFQQLHRRIGFKEEEESMARLSILRVLRYQRQAHSYSLSLWYKSRDVTYNADQLLE